LIYFDLLGFALTDFDCGAGEARKSGMGLRGAGFGAGIRTGTESRSFIWFDLL
jgi:hypothetical protein